KVTYMARFVWEWIASRPRSRRECFDIFFSAYESALRASHQQTMPKKKVIAFTPRVNFIKRYPRNETFFTDFPDGAMICICRQPADWYASASRHGPAYADPQRAMALWRESAESAMLLKERYSSQVILVPFSELVRNRSEIMRKLGDSLGLFWSE